MQLAIPNLAIPNFVSGSFDKILSPADAYNMAGMQLAIPNFVSGSFDETLSPADAYNMAADSSFPIIDDILNVFGKDFNFSETFGAAKEFIKKNKPLISEITKKGKIVLGKGDLTQRLLAGSSLASMALSGLSTETTNQMSKYITDNKDTLVKIGDIAKKVNGADISDISGIGKLITSVTGDSTLFSINDKDGISAVCSTIVSECNKLGLPNALTELSKVMPDMSVITQTAQNLLPDAIKGGDFNLFNEIATILPNNQGSMQYPTAIKDFLKNFDLPKDVKISDIPNIYNKLKDSFTKFDNEWLKDNSNSNSTPNAIDTINGTAITTCNKDAEKVISTGILNTNNEDEQMLALAALYGDTDVDHEFFKLYPTCAIGEFQRKQTKVTTPSPDNKLVQNKIKSEPLKLTSGGYIQTTQSAYISIGGIVDPGDIKPIIKNDVIGDPLW